MLGLAGKRPRGNNDWGGPIAREAALTGQAPAWLSIMIASRRTHHYAMAFVSFGLGWAILCHPWLGGDFTIPYDAKAHFQAQIQFLATALHTGQSPFWTPNVFGGSPQIADPQSMIFTPALLLAYFNPQPSIAVVDAYVFGLLALGGLALLMLFRDQDWHPVGGLIAAFVFAFGGSAAWRVQHVGQVVSYAFFAVSLWLLVRALDRRSIAWGIAAGASAGLMIVAPDQVALLGAYVLAGYVIWYVASTHPRQRTALQLLPVIGSSALSGLAIVLVPLLLTYMFVEQSSRPLIVFAEATRGSLHPASLLTTLVGDLYGALDPKVEYWGPYSSAWDPNELTLSQNMSQVYFGALPLLLVLGTGLVRGAAWAREVRYFTCALFAMVIYALGGFTPIFKIFYWIVPGVSFFRRPADATFLIGALAAIVAGYLAHRLIAGGVPAKARWQRITEHGLLAGLVVSGLVIAYLFGHLADAIRPTAIAAIGIAVAGAAIWTLERYGRSNASLCAVGIAAVMVGDLSVNNGPNESTALSVARYDFLKPNCENETIRFLKARLKQPANSSRRDRIELVGMGFSWPNIGLIHGFDHVLGYNPLRLDVIAKAVGAEDSIAGWEQRRFTPLFPSYRSQLADMLGLRYIVTPIPIEGIDKRLKPGEMPLVARTADAFIYENARALPRAMFVSNWKLADFDELIETGAWPAFDPKQTLLLEREPIGEDGTTALDTSGAGTASIARYENTKVEIAYQSSDPGFVLLNSVWHPWWRATVDSEPAEILKANVMFQAVRVPAGRHSVKLEFEPFTGALDEMMRATARTQVSTRPNSPSRRPRT